MELKIKFLIITFLIVGLKLSCFSQQPDTTFHKLPEVILKDINGKRINTAEITNNGKPILICFWKTCCKPPVNMLDEIAEVYDQWVEETGVVLYAVSIDETKSSSRVAPFVNAKGWDYKVLLDPNSDFKRAMNIGLIPHTFLLDGNGRIVWQKAMYFSGDYEELYKQIKNL